MYVVFVTVLYLTPHYALLSPFTNECFKVLYGKFTFNDIFLPFENSSLANLPTKQRQSQHLPMPFVFNLRFQSPRHQDLIDFNELSEQVDNLTRRKSASFYGYTDPEDWYWFREKIEGKKKNMLININLQFLIHTRYKVYAALSQRAPFRDDKRYKMGYLFNRLRRSKTEMRKVISLASMQNSSDPRFRSLHSLLRYYEQVVRYDVDIRDTMALIDKLYEKLEPYDFYKTNFYKGRSKTGNGTR